MLKKLFRTNILFSTFLFFFKYCSLIKLIFHTNKLTDFISGIVDLLTELFCFRIANFQRLFLIFQLGVVFIFLFVNFKGCFLCFRIISTYNGNYLNKDYILCRAITLSKKKFLITKYCKQAIFKLG